MTRRHPLPLHMYGDPRKSRPLEASRESIIESERKRELARQKSENERRDSELKYERILAERKVAKLDIPRSLLRTGSLASREQEHELLLARRPKPKCALAKPTDDPPELEAVIYDRGRTFVELRVGQVWAGAGRFGSLRLAEIVDLDREFVVKMDELGRTEYTTHFGFLGVDNYPGSSTGIYGGWASYEAERWEMYPTTAEEKKRAAERELGRRTVGPQRIGGAGGYD